MLGGVARLCVYPVLGEKKKKEVSPQPFNSLAPIINFHRTDGSFSLGLNGKSKIKKRKMVEDKD